MRWPPIDITWRDTPRAEDADAVRGIVASTGVFRADEVEVAVELLEVALREGPSAGYHFLFAHPPGGDAAAAPDAYACFGPIPCTVRRYDLYWIAVRGSCQKRGLGQAVLAAALGRMAGLGAVRCFVETSGTAAYAPTRKFYERGGGRPVARIADYYDAGDDLVVYAWEMA